MKFYTDGGPDHRTTYISTQLSLIALFLKPRLPQCGSDIAPHHSWRNPVKRMMSILNLGFQGISLKSDAAKAALKNCNSTAICSVCRYSTVKSNIKCLSVMVLYTFKFTDGTRTLVKLTPYLAELQKAAEHCDFKDICTKALRDMFI